MKIAVLILLGLCFGSFVNALVWRLREQSLTSKKRKSKADDLSISKGRSMCVNCKHTLSALDLIPVLSWISLKGKCRYCHKPISWQYPVVEAATAVLFVISYIYWPFDIEGLEIAVFGLWLVSLVGLMALLVYDIRWMILPNKLIFPLYGVAAAFVISKCLADVSISPLLGAVGGIAVGGGIFYLLFQVSQGRWIGGGDVKLGFLLGALMLSPLNAALMLFIASLLGTLLLLPLLIRKGSVTKDTRIPFGPFLITAAIIIQLVGTSVIDWYVRNFIDI